MLKVVVDTSVFVAGYLSRTGTSYSAQVISRWRAGDFRLVMSSQILEEIAAKFIDKEIEEERIVEFITAVGRLALNVPGSYVVYRLDNIDPDDNMLLSAAQEASADYLVSLDAKHLLPLKHHKGTQILNPTLFIRILDREQQEEPGATEDETKLTKSRKKLQQNLL
ncbi:MAG: putative toxin-antitoxin system toxin component, PIN family [Candidatus Melainabacteria bacterium]|nr:putative toxin-antitoxin system toxin component, PIN family [Candidatus Melainabacteria bacterium]